MSQIECDRCDGCGWYEGGPTLQTECKKCGGTGVVEDLDAVLFYESPAVRAGAIAFLTCDYCGALPGKDCVVVVGRPALAKYAHIARRMKYVELRDILGEPNMARDVEDLLG